MYEFHCFRPPFYGEEMGKDHYENGNEGKKC